MFLRLVLLALALCFACAAARPHHLSPLEHDLADLEQGLDKIIDLEEDDDDDDDDEDEDEETGDPYLVALDCGSSGTKALLFTVADGDCPPEDTTNYKLCQYVKYFPTITHAFFAKDGFGPVFARSEPETPSRIESTSIGVLDDVQQNIVGIVAMATAGNRIKTVDQNVTAWTSLKDALETYYPRLYSHGTVYIPQTIPGTHEAWFEMKTNNGGNFVSMGGASAQMGILLKTDEMVDAWEVALNHIQNNADYKQTMCNNQNHISHFITTVASSEETSYTPLAQESTQELSSIKTTCKRSKRCVGLISWLSVTNLGGSDDCPTLHVQNSGLVSHYAGGADTSKALFRLWQTEQGREKICFGSVGEVDPQKCAADHFIFSRKDRLMNVVQHFMKTAGSRADAFKVMATLIFSVKEFNKLKHLRDWQDSLINPGPKGTPYFALWGTVGIVIASRVQPDELLERGEHPTFASINLDVNDHDWINTAASFIKYGTDQAFSKQCKLPFKAETYNPVPDDTDCKVYLDRPPVRTN